MSTRIKTKGQIKLEAQPDWMIENDGYGLLTSRITFKCDADNVSSRPKAGAAHPADDRLKCFKSSYVVNASNIATITAEYIGIDEGTYTKMQISGDVALNTASIELHPKFNTGNVGETGKPLKDLGWDDAAKEFSGSNADAIKYGLAGVKSFYSPDIQISGQFYTNNTEVVTITQKMVGKTFDKIPNVADYLVPAIGVSISKYHDRFCLVTGMSYENYNTVYKVKFTFRLAGGGWHNLIYEKYN
jgi:hypothetical protein